LVKGPSLVDPVSSSVSSSSYTSLHFPRYSQQFNFSLSDLIPLSAAVCRKYLFRCGQVMVVIAVVNCSYIVNL
jgi:hypothetical protein